MEQRHLEKIVLFAFKNDNLVIESSSSSIIQQKLNINIADDQTFLALRLIFLLHSVKCQQINMHPIWQQANKIKQ